MKIGVHIFAVGLFVSAFLPIITSAQVTCAVPGTEPITDRALARLSGIPDDQPCWNPKDATTGTEAAQAKQYLLSIAKNLRNSAAPPDAAHIEPLNAAFAICAAKFLKAYAASYGPVNVVSAFRCGPISPSTLQCDRTENSRAGGANNSNHQLGSAMDINPAGGNSSYETLKSFAQANPGYGVNFPWPYYQGKTDKPHMQAVNTKNPSCTGVTGTPITPGPGGLGTTPGQVLGSAPSLMQGLQNFFSPPQPQQCPAGYMLLNGSCVPPQAAQITQTASPFSYAPTPTPSPTPVSSTIGGTGSTGSTNTAGSSGTTGGITTIGSSVSDTGTGISISSTIDSGTTKKTGTTTSAVDLINAIANPTSTKKDAGSVEIGKSVALNDTLGNKSSLNGTLASSSATLAGSTTYALAPVGSQTFVSQDLSKTPVQQFGVTNNSTFALLENIKRVLLTIIQMLKPFGGVTPTGTVNPSGNTATAVLR